MVGFLHMIIYIVNQKLYFLRIGDFAEECLTVKNRWELFTGDHVGGILKFVIMINGREVIMECPI